MLYDNKIICNTSLDASKPDGTIDYVGLYKIRPEKRGNIMTSRVYNYNSCKNKALQSGRNVFGLSGFDPTSQTAYCFLDDKLENVIDNYSGKNLYVGNDKKTYSGDRNVSAIYYIHQGRPWQCVEGVNIPVRVNEWDNLECMSANGKDCITAPNMSQCRNYTVRPVKGKPIQCNQDKYNDPSHWCSRVRDAERFPPGRFDNPNVYGNGKLPVKPVSLLSKILPVAKPKPKPKCCCPPPDPKKYMLRTDFQKLLNRKIEYHRDYKILMDKYAKQDQRGYISCKDSSLKRNVPLSQPKPLIPEEPKSIPVKPSKASKASALCGVECKSMCCPPPDMRKYILKTEAEKILASQKIQDHPEYKALMDSFAVKKANGEYMACRVQI
jgi:hypothetical protein